jgi:hypothetical protein
MEKYLSITKYLLICSVILCFNSKNTVFGLETSIIKKSFNVPKTPPDTTMLLLKDVELPIIFDTIISNYAISFIISTDTGFTIKSRLFENVLEIEKHPNRKVCVILKKSSSVFYEDCFCKYSFNSILQKETNIHNFLLTNFVFESVENGNTVFHTSICVPDTDFCYFVDISISEDGQMKYIEIIEDDEEW